MSRRSRYSPNSNPRPQVDKGAMGRVLNSVGNLGLVGVAGLAAVVLGLGSFHRTGTNEVGVRTRKLGFKKGVDAEAYQPGSTYMFLPFVNTWDTFDTKLQVVEMTGEAGKGDRVGNDELEFFTKDGNPINLDLIVSYQIIPDKAPYIRQFVAEDMDELKNKVVRGIARARSRDAFGVLETQQFYDATQREQAAEKAKTYLNEILNEEFGVKVVAVSPKDYRFDDRYSSEIELKKLAEETTKQLDNKYASQTEKNAMLLNQAIAYQNEQEKLADGEYNRAVIDADAYYTEQSNLADAILTEGKNQAETITKLREAMASEGGDTLVKMEMIRSLQGKEIKMLPYSTGAAGNQLMVGDMNEFAEQAGIFKALQATQPKN